MKTVDSFDRLELYDGVSGSLLTILSGFIANPIRITSDSNVLDVKFVSDRLNVADGFQAEYDGACKRPVFIFLLMLLFTVYYLPCHWFWLDIILLHHYIHSYIVKVQTI